MHHKPPKMRKTRGNSKQAKLRACHIPKDNASKHPPENTQNSSQAPHNQRARQQKRLSQLITSRRNMRKIQKISYVIKDAFAHPFA